MVAISNPPPGTPSGLKWIGATSIYGISDLVEWAKDMHKFQRGYVGWLVGGSYEEIPEVYKERSPITHADKINTPLLVSLIPSHTRCENLDFEVDRELCRSSTDWPMRSFSRARQNVFSVC